MALVAISSQLGTAHLAGLLHTAGLIAFAAGAIGFAAFGANRFLVTCADSTIAPIFAGGLATLAATGSVWESPMPCIGTISFTAWTKRLGRSRKRRMSFLKIRSRSRVGWRTARGKLEAWRGGRPQSADA